MPSPTKFSALQVGTGVLTGLVAGYAFFSQGSIEVHNTGEIDFRGADVILSLTGTDVLRVRQVTCASTGASRSAEGNSQNRTCNMSNPLSTSGSIHRLQVEVAGAANAAVNWSCGHSSGTAVTNAGICTGSTLINRKSATSGTTLVYVSTGSNTNAHNTWQGGENLCCSTTSDPGTVDAVMRVWFSDTYAD
tara:strand:- start:1027 stop:1599 length:573 start_codon:yes stop_codon:yes gene_type:complete